jgi:VanZ family protein
MMTVSRNRLRLCITLIICNILFIWGNSLLPGEISGAISDGVRRVLLPFLPEGSSNAHNAGGILRKVGHFTEFCCLGLSLSWLFRMKLSHNWQHIFLPLLAGVAVASADETIQIFVPDRGPALKDVGIDTLGVILGIVIISLVQHCKTKKMEENQL